MINSILTIIGTLASIFGAIIAVIEARKAKKSADYINEVKGQLLKQRHLNELSKLQVKTDRIKKIMAKYGPAATQFSLSGISVQSDAEELQDYIICLVDYKDLFENPSDTDVIYNTLSQLVENLVNATDIGSTRNTGKQILLNLSNISSQIKKRLDAQHIDIVSNGK